MALHRSFGLTETDRSPDLKDWDDGEGPSPQNQSPASPASSLEESVAPQAVEESPASSSTWVGSLQSGTDDEAEETTPAESSWGLAPAETQSSEWEVSDAPGPVAGAWSLNDSIESPQAAVDDNEPDELASSEGSDSSSQPPEWGPTLLEPKSADWLIEQSEPVDGGVGQIVQPDAWSGFVSSDDDDGSATPETDSSGDDDDERAWGT